MSTGRFDSIRVSAERRSERIFWRFQAGFWITVALFQLLMGFSVRPHEPLEWGDTAVRVGSGFLASSAVHLLFQRPRLRRLPRSVKWPLVMVATAVSWIGILVASHSLRLGGELDWVGDSYLGQIVPRLVSRIGRPMALRQASAEQRGS